MRTKANKPRESPRIKLMRSDGEGGEDGDDDCGDSINDDGDWGEGEGDGEIPKQRCGGLWRREQFKSSLSEKKKNTRWNRSKTA